MFPVKGGGEDVEGHFFSVTCERVDGAGGRGGIERGASC